MIKTFFINSVKKLNFGPDPESELELPVKSDTNPELPVKADPDPK